jgi:protein MPE1
MLSTPHAHLYSASWEKQITGRAKGLTEADIRERPLSDKSLGCSICSNLFRDAVRTPCCSKTFCEECIQSHLLENEFTCPNCRKNIASVDRLIMDKPMRTRVMDYIDKQIVEGNAEAHTQEAPSVTKQVGHFVKTKNNFSNSWQETTRENGTPEAEVSFDKQPGGPNDVVPQSGEPDKQAHYRENQSFDQIQAEIQQLQTMLSNPKLPMHIRNSASMQLMQKQTLLNQAQTMSTFISQAQQAVAMEGAMMQAMYNQQQQQQQQMNYGNQQGRTQGGWINPDTQVNQSHTDSPYQRLPINQRRKYMRRDRPSDFVEVSGQYYQ